MTDAIKQDVENAEFFTEQDIRIFSFDIRQSMLLHRLAEELATIGGPQVPGAQSKASLAATELKLSLSTDQCELLATFSNGLVCVLIFEGLQKSPMPAHQMNCQTWHPWKIDTTSFAWRPVIRSC